MSASGWVGFDLDGTLAKYGTWQAGGLIGDPIAPMIERVKRFLAEGVEVRIITARVAICNETNDIGQKDDHSFAAQQTRLIQDWCEKHIGQRLKVTASKDFQMISFYDDRCVQVEMNTGRIIGREL